MAQPSNTYDTYDLVGGREDLSNVIYNISPTDVPFMSNIGRGKATSILHEWQTDSLASASSNAVIEGDDSTAEAQVATARISNRTQISKKVVLVTGTANATNKAGRGKSELSFLLAKAGKELKRDMEVDLTGKNAPVTGNATTARKLRGYESWAQTNASRGSGGSDHASTFVVTDGTQRAFTEAMMKTAMQSCFTNGGDPDCVMVGPFNKTKVSAFSGIATQYRDNQNVGPAKIIASADVYVSDWGEVKIVPNRFQRDRTALIIEKDKWAVSYLRPFRQEKLAKTGDSDKVHMLVEYTLEARQEASSGKVADLTTS
jgi:hypothetical protein